MMQTEVQFTIANPEVEPSEEMLDLLAHLIAEQAISKARARLSQTSEHEAA